MRRRIRVVRYLLYRETLLNYKEQLRTFISSFTGIALIGLYSSNAFTGLDNLFLIGSFGASAVLLYGLIESPLAKPRNLFGGHLLSAFIGVTIQLSFPHDFWLTAALAVSLSIVLMQVTKTLHPPGGATAMIAVMGSEKIKSLGYLYLINPVLIGVLILFSVAMIFRKMSSER